MTNPNPMADFYIRERAEQGKTVLLTKPDGSPSEHFIVIRSRWSDNFIKFREESMREVARRTAADRSVDAVALAKEQAVQMVAALVIDWSFPQPVTHEEVVKFLREAPQIQEKLDKLAADDNYFFKDGSVNSSGGQSPSSR